MAGPEGPPRGLLGRADELALVPDSLLLSLLLPLSRAAPNWHDYLGSSV